MATGQVGAAEVSFRARVDQLNRDLAAGRASTQRAARAMAQDLGKVEQATKRIGESSRRTSLGIQAMSRQFLVLRAAASAAVAALGIRQVAQAADAWVIMNARLGLVTKNGQEASDVLAELFNIAQRSRSDLGATVDFFFKLSNASKELGVSQQQSLQITETLNKLMKVGGVDAVRAAQAIYQLSQSFTKQRLAGDELRTVYEAFPGLLNLIAERMTAAGEATTAMELATRKGGLDVRTMLEAVLASATDVDNRFGMLTVTIGDSITQIANSLTKAVGQTALSGGAFNDITSALRQMNSVINSPEFQTGLDWLITEIAIVARNSAQAVADLGNLINVVITLKNKLSEMSMEDIGVAALTQTGREKFLNEINYEIAAYQRGRQEAQRYADAAAEAGRSVSTEIPGGGGPSQETLDQMEDLRGKIRDVRAEIQATTMEGIDTEAAAQMRDLATAADIFGLSIQEVAKADPGIRQLVQTFVDLQAALRGVTEENERAARAREDLREGLQREADEHKKFQEETAAFVRQERDATKQRIDSASRLPDEIDTANIAAQGLAHTLTDFENLNFDSIAEGIAGIGRQLAEAALQAMIFRAIMGAAGPPGAGTTSGFIVDPFVPSRHGNVFADGRLKRMAQGGFITNRPMIMPMQTGGALIGEAGPEAVLPLKRMASGNLGVASAGGSGGSGNTINIDARQSTPGTAAAAVNAAIRMAPGAVVNAQARGQMGRGKHPF